ncbi:MAG TPA: hypothetical protein P5560_02675 [Thermotogota bacterium]|nr:hypothetical protein [Thermotogota bacterium]
MSETIAAAVSTTPPVYPVKKPEKDFLFRKAQKLFSEMLLLDRDLSHYSAYQKMISSLDRGDTRTFHRLFETLSRQVETMLSPSDTLRENIPPVPSAVTSYIAPPGQSKEGAFRGFRNPQFFSATPAGLQMQSDFRQELFAARSWNRLPSFLEGFGFSGSVRLVGNKPRLMFYDRMFDPLKGKCLERLC